MKTHNIKPTKQNETNNRQLPKNKNEKGQPINIKNGNNKTEHQQNTTTK